MEKIGRPAQYFLDHARPGTITLLLDRYFAGVKGVLPLSSLPFAPISAPFPGLPVFPPGPITPGDLPIAPPPSRTLYRSTILFRMPENPEISTCRNVAHTVEIEGGEKENRGHIGQIEGRFPPGRGRGLSVPETVDRRRDPAAAVDEIRTAKPVYRLDRRMAQEPPELHHVPDIFPDDRDEADGGRFLVHHADRRFVGDDAGDRGRRR